MMVRAMTVKSELSDTEGLKFKLEEKFNEILEFKKAIKLKVHTYSILIHIVLYMS